MSKTETILNVLRGQAYIETPLQDYHAAKAVLAAMRRKNANERLIGVREALNKYRVTAWNHDGGIVLRKNGADALVLEA